MTEIGGIDFAWARPAPPAVKQCGYSFVIGYLSGGGSKDLTAAQIAAYRAAGLMVGLVWETTANRVTGGAAAGAADGAAAEAEADRVGYPRDAVIFFAVDFDAQPSDFSTIAAYAAAFNQATNRPVGIYGSFDVVEHFVTPGQQPVQYGWQTAAWSNGELSAKAHLYQRVGHVNWPIIPGISALDFDEDVLCIPLPLMGAAAPAPKPVPGPAPAPAPKPAPKPAPAPSALAPGQTLAVGQALLGGAYRFTMQADGNAVVYGPSGARWATNTSGHPGARLVFQTDQNIVVYLGTKPLWASNTRGSGATRLVMQADGNLVAYTAAHKPVWSLW